MPEYQKDGAKVECRPARNPAPGQVLVMAFVDWGRLPLARYAQPAIFTVIGTDDEHRDDDEERGPYWLLRDAAGDAVRVSSFHMAHFYDAQEWVMWDKGRQAEMIRRERARVAKLEGHLALLKDILTAQGIRLVTNDQAEALGLKVTAPAA